MRIYSNKYLSVPLRLDLWKNWHAHIIYPAVRSDIIYKVDEVHKNDITFVPNHTHRVPPVDFMTEFVWEYPDKQIGVSMLDLKYYNIYQMDRRIYKSAIRLPMNVQTDDLVYVDTSKISLVN